MIEISIGIIVAIFLTFVLWIILTAILLDGAEFDGWKELALACAFTATPFALGWLIYVLQYSGVIVFVK
jgi:hypothetical protein